MQSEYVARAEIERELGPGELLLWAGQPRAGLVLRPSDLYLIPFSLVWFGFTVFWQYSVLTGGAPIFFVLWGAMFNIFGLYFVAGRFFVDAALRRRTWYGVTSERALIVGGLLSRSVRSLPLRSLPEIALEQRRDGGGTITFGTGPAQWARGMIWPGVSDRMAPAFELLPDARHVYETIRAAQRAAS